MIPALPQPEGFLKHVFIVFRVQSLRRFHGFQGSFSASVSLFPGFIPCVGFIVFRVHSLRGVSSFSGFILCIGFIVFRVHPLCRFHGFRVHALRRFHCFQCSFSTIGYQSSVDHDRPCFGSQLGTLEAKKVGQISFKKLRGGFQHSFDLPFWLQGRPSSSAKA